MIYSCISHWYVLLLFLCHGVAEISFIMMLLSGISIDSCLFDYCFQQSFQNAVGNEFLSALV